MHGTLSHLSEPVLAMLHEALDAFARMDTDKAFGIIARGTSINKEFNDLSRLLITYMMEDSHNIKRALRINWCARSLERIGDHSRNICEYVIFLVKGKDIRHTNFEEVIAEHLPDDDSD